MSDKKENPESVLVMPVNGKFCEVVYTTDGGATASYKIWKVHPSSPDSYGTPIPYDLAIEFLCKTPPVITLVSSVKDGKFVSPLLEEDQKRVQEALSRGFVAGKNYNAEVSEDSGKGGDASKLSAALTKTTKLLEAQVEKNTALESQLAVLAERLGKLEKK